MSNDPRAALTLDEIEEKLYDLYRWFAVTAPGVTPNPDVGELGLLWRIFDDYTMRDNRDRREDVQ